jgi:hypothetical protein
LPSLSAAPAWGETSFPARGVSRDPVQEHARGTADRATLSRKEFRVIQIVAKLRRRAAFTAVLASLSLLSPGLANAQSVTPPAPAAPAKAGKAAKTPKVRKPKAVKAEKPYEGTPARRTGLRQERELAVAPVRLREPYRGDERRRLDRLRHRLHPHALEPLRVRGGHQPRHRRPFREAARRGGADDRRVPARVQVERRDAPYLGVGGGFYFRSSIAPAASTTPPRAVAGTSRSASPSQLDDKHVVGFETRVAWVQGRPGVVNPTFGAGSDTETIWTAKLTWALVY